MIIGITNDSDRTDPRFVPKVVAKCPPAEVAKIPILPESISYFSAFDLMNFIARWASCIDPS